MCREREREKKINRQTGQSEVRPRIYICTYAHAHTHTHAKPLLAQETRKPTLRGRCLVCLVSSRRDVLKL